MRNNANVDSISASSGSPPTNVYHTTAPMNQLRDMLLTDMEHSNSNDHNDVKDLSFRNQPQQAPVITSTAPPIVHLDSSNHDFDSSRASSVHADTEPSNEKTDNHTHSVRVRKLSESSHHTDHEHSHNNYKFKNYIQQRFSQDNNSSHHGEHHEETASSINLIHENSQSGDKSPSDTAPPHAKKSKLYADFAECSSCDEAKPTTNGITEFKTEPLLNHGFQLFPKPTANSSNARFPHNTVPIFALHAQGRHYIPLNVDYEALVPYLGGFDLLDKNCNNQMAPCHSININVNFSPPNRSKLANTVFNGRSKAENVMCNGW